MMSTSTIRYNRKSIFWAAGLEAPGTEGTIIRGRASEIHETLSERQAKDSKFLDGIRISDSHGRYVSWETIVAIVEAHK